MSSLLTLVLFFVLLAIGLGIGFALLFLKKRQRRQVDGLFYDSQQGPIFYKVLGRRGPWIVLLHGLGGSTYCWRNVAPDLSKKYRVLIVDLWGFGHSSKALNNKMTLDSQTDVLMDLFSHLSISKYHIVGHSMGGQIALWLKKMDPRVDKCIAVTPSAHPSLVAQWLKSFSWIASWTPYILTPNAIKRVLVRSVEDPAFVTEEMVRNYYIPYEDPQAHVCFAAGLDVIRDPRVYDSLPTIKENLWVFWAGHDLVISRKLMRIMNDQLENATVITHPWSGHLPMEDDHRWLVDQIFAALG